MVPFISRVMYFVILLSKQWTPHVRRLKKVLNKQLKAFSDEINHWAFKMLNIIGLNFRGEACLDTSIDSRAHNDLPIFRPNLIPLDLWKWLRYRYRVAGGQLGFTYRKGSRRQHQKNKVVFELKHTKAIQTDWYYRSWYRSTDRMKGKGNAPWFALAFHWVIYCEFKNNLRIIQIKEEIRAFFLFHEVFVTPNARLRKRALVSGHHITKKENYCLEFGLFKICQRTNGSRKNFSSILYKIRPPSMTLFFIQ
jgi:hypothetical protein